MERPGAIKADPELAAIPVVILSILDEQEKGFALGAADYLTKPFDREPKNLSEGSANSITGGEVNETIDALWSGPRAPLSGAR